MSLSPSSSRRNPRRALKQTSMPNLLPANAPPTLGPVTTFEISDPDVGLDADPLAQAEAERFIRASLHKGPHAPAPRQPFKPLSIRIAVAADETDGGDPLEDVASTLDRVTAPLTWSDLQ